MAQWEIKVYINNAKQATMNIQVHYPVSLRKRWFRDMSRTLYVGNLPWGTSETDLADLFSPHGEVVSSRIITDKETGRSRGFGFVEVGDADADKMIDAMNGTDVGGRQIVVNEAKPKQGRM
jgi:RNA recognition motif-containing protein